MSSEEKTRLQSKKSDWLQPKKSDWIDGRIPELQAIEDLQVLRFSRREGRLEGLKNIYVLCPSEIRMVEGGVEDMPLSHRNLIKEIGIIEDKDWIHLKSVILDEESGEWEDGYAISINVHQYESGGHYLRAVRRFGGVGRHERSFSLGEEESIFVVANMVSLTAKKGEKQQLRRARISLRRTGWVESLRNDTIAS